MTKTTKLMNQQEALATVVDIASRWGENTEEGFIRRIQPHDTDEECALIADKSGWEVEDVIEVRDLWRAISLLNEQLHPLDQRPGE